MSENKKLLKQTGKRQEFSNPTGIIPEKGRRVVRLLVLSLFFVSICGADNHIDAVELFLSNRDSHINRLGHNTPFRKGYPETVFLLSRHSSVGTGVFIGHRMIVSALHLFDDFEGRMEDEWSFQDPNTLEFIPIARSLYHDPKHDLIILEPEKGYSATEFYRLNPQSDESSLYVSAVGFPALEFNVTGGVVSEDELMSAPFMSVKALPSSLDSFFSREIFAPEGFSGGPILFEDGGLAGIVVKGDTNGRILYTPTERIRELKESERRNAAPCALSVCIRKTIEEWKKKVEDRRDDEADDLFAYGVSRLSDDDEPDVEKAFGALKQAAEKGHAHAQFDVGVMYLMGWGTLQSYEKAALYLTRARKQGFHFAHGMLIYKKSLED